VLSDSPDTGAWLRGTVEAGRVDGYQVGRVATRSGADTEAIHALVPRATDADWVVVQAGTNDLLGGDTPRQAVSGVKSLVSDVRAEGPSVIVALVPPSDERPTRVQQVNNRLQRWASQKGIGVLDVYSPVADSDGSYRAGLSDDGVRANAAGGRLEARAVARQLPDLLG
jgi:lysophospholipase L1-like esterase